VTVTIYGIKNCDTMKKARTWLDAKGVDYRFHDYKAEGIDKASLKRFVDALGWETVQPCRHHVPRACRCR
jgi:arsenate reductase